MTHPNQWTNRTRVRTYRDVYPLGRKFCSRCRHWRHVCDFGVRTWADEPTCTVPHLIQSMCRGCATTHYRGKRGYNPRVLYPHGRPGSEEHREYTRARNRRTARARWRDKKKRDEVVEYQRIWRDAKKAEEARENGLIDDD